MHLKIYSVITERVEIESKIFKPGVENKGL